MKSGYFTDFVFVSYKPMKLRMIFKFGVTVIIVVAIIIYFLIQNQNESRLDSNTNLDKLAKDVYKEPTQEKNQDSKNRKTSKNNDESSINTYQVRVDHDNGDKNTVFTLKPVISSSPILNKHEGIHLGIVVCGDRFEESLVVFKSAVLFTSAHLYFHIFTEKDHQKKFQSRLDFWPEEYRSKIDYYIYDITYPPGENADEWKKLFKLCASQRLFIPHLLTNVDSLLYVDTDVMFLSPVDDVYNFFKLFNDSHIAAMAPEHEDAATGWYNRFARHPYYGALGLNSGVMLMNLTRIRQTNWLGAIQDYYKEYKLQITWGDQDLLNIYFHYYPQQIYVYSCDWNYRPDHCMYMSVCKDIEKNGVKVLHGSRRVFHNEKQPAFRAVYKAISDHKFSNSIEYELLHRLNKLLGETDSTNCGKIKQIFMKQIQNYCQQQNS